MKLKLAARNITSNDGRGRIYATIQDWPSRT